MGRRGGYAGSAAIVMFIVRWRNTATGQIQLDEPEIDENEETLEAVHEQPLWEEADFECEVSASGHYAPGRYSGPPEDCEPDDEDFEITDFSSNCPIVGTWEDLTDDERAKAEELLMERIREPSYDDPY